ncbi:MULTISPECIES: DMT family transporter [Acinetobacter]|jgi:drug/metabolite transporter (DMT)-like permease|uniref:DMT family transporter n=1 Tax=Acinetobacter pittii TaxID=48296 RepID=A0AAE9SC70_ACIPI|nr:MULTISPECIES: DMT family transporter [Acinetobacter calcoaceticus/baumannii complex]AZP28998.1 EamA/RhaT family transporter [Acinetobacter pittii]EXE28560.1 eamA-like transporter family protein [Acinetobacter sp. 907131]EXS12972.1 eamA-like transporter family protein [Acinetobacter sp. 883425]MBK0412220.1 DMT family transporter [Acinetobacter pittii]MBK1418375.1 DMT family transporter [Acinetobacter pittii]
MRLNKQMLASQSATSTFVLLWGSAAIFTRWGLDSASPIALLILRFATALFVLLLIAIFRKRLLPKHGTRKQVLLTGLLIIAGYSICYFKAMAHGVTPGLMATIMGIQPILTLCLLEKNLQKERLLGLLIALAGLILLVWKSLTMSFIAPIGIFFALAALICITFGAIMQKNIQQAPTDVLPLQYVVSLVVCLFIVPFEHFEITWNSQLIISVLFLGILISVVAQLLLYRLLNQGNLVNVTSLFYLVPVVTALLDFLILKNKLPLAGLIGMIAILIGLMLVFKKK